MRNLLATLSIAALMAVPAAAQDMGHSMTAGVGVGAAMPVSDLFDEFADPGLAFGGFVTGQISGALGWRAEGAWDGMELPDVFDEACDQADIDCDKPHVTRFNGGVQFGPSSGRARPFAFFTVGAYNVDFGEGDSETDFGMGLGGGVNFLLGDNWGAGGDVHFHGIFPGDDLDTQWYVAPEGVFFFSF